MLEIKITVACPDLPLAASALAAAISRRPMLTAESAPAPTAARPPMPTSTPVNPTPAASVNPTPAIPAAASVNPTPAVVPPVPVQTTTAPYPTAAPTCPAVAPTAPAPTYTTDQITKAGAELVQAGKMGELMALLQNFGVQAVTQVPQERLGELANALRGMGAKL